MQQKPKISIIRLLNWFSCPLSVRLEESEGKSRDTHERLTRKAVIYVLAKAYSPKEKKEGESADVDKWVWPVWKLLLTQANIPADSLKDMLNNYVTERARLISETGTYITNKSAKILWNTQLMQKDVLRSLRNHINEHQSKLGLPSWSIVSSPEMKGMDFQANTLADAYADSIEILSAFKKHNYIYKKILFGTNIAWELKNAILVYPIDVLSIDLHDEITADMIIFDAVGGDIKSYYDSMLRAGDIRLLYQENKYSIIGEGASDFPELFKVDALRLFGGNAYTRGYYNATQLKKLDGDKFSNIKRNLSLLTDAYLNMKDNGVLYRQNLTLRTQHDICGRCSYLDKCYGGLTVNYIENINKNDVSSTIDLINDEQERLFRAKSEKFTNLAKLASNKYSAFELAKYMVDSLLNTEDNRELLKTYRRILENMGA